MSGIEVALVAAGMSASAASAVATTATVLSTGLTLASAGSALFGGIQDAQMMKSQSKMQAQALEMSAREDLLDAKTESIRGKQETNDMMDSLLQTVSSQRLSYQANGMDANFGTPVSLNESTSRLANLQMGITRSDAQVRAIARRRQSYANTIEAQNTLTVGKQKASSAITGGVLQSGGGIVNLIERRSSRGKKENKE